MAKVRNRNRNRDLFSPMEATHTSQYIENMYDSNEQNTIQTLTDESIVLGGYMIYYVFRTEVDIDEVLFEPNTSTFSQAFQIAATFPEYVSGWNDSESFLNKFGIDTKASGEFILSQRAWDVIMKERSKEKLYTYYKPREGDLIVMYGSQRWEKPDDPNVYEQNKIVFQINYVDKSQNNWQFGKDYVWKVSASAYKYDETENLDVKTDDGDMMFDVIEDFERGDHSDHYTDEEEEIKVWDDENPFGGY